MKKITVSYWHGSKYINLKYEHNSDFKYSLKKRNEIIDDVLSKGYAIMLKIYNLDPTILVIWIDNGRFGQS